MTKNEKRFIYAVMHSSLPYQVRCCLCNYVHYTDWNGHNFKITAMSKAFNYSRDQIAKHLRYAVQEGWLVKNKREETGLPHYYFLRVPADDRLEELETKHREDPE